MIDHVFIINQSKCKYHVEHFLLKTKKHPRPPDGVSLLLRFRSVCWFDSGGLAVEILWFWWLNSGNFAISGGNFAILKETLRSAIEFDSDQLFDLILSILVETLQFGIRISYIFKYTRKILRITFRKVYLEKNPGFYIFL